MSENPDPVPDSVPSEEKKPDAPDTTAEDEAYRKMMEDLGLDEVETPEQIEADRNHLRKMLRESVDSLTRLRAENLKLSGQLDMQKTEAAQTIARTKNQVDEQKEFVLEKFVSEILPVVDNLERGLSAIPKAQRAADPKFEKIAQGVEKTLTQLTAVFNKFGIREINPKGEIFDPARHEAISARDDPDAESDTVIEVAQKGYELNGRVIRSAKVIVKT